MFVVSSKKRDPSVGFLYFQSDYVPSAWRRIPEPEGGMSCLYPLLSSRGVEFDFYVCPWNFMADTHPSLVVYNLGRRDCASPTL